MKRTIFYSWQADLPNPTNRGFIGKALDSAVAALAADDDLAVEPVVDRDTAGVPGSPDIAATIFSKIESATVFVADVSIIGRTADGRPTPNPNVLVELGYALRALGPDRLLLVFNEAYGALKDLPFDLRARRIQRYTADPSQRSGRPRARGDLAAALELALKAHLAEPLVSASDISSTLGAIETGAPNRKPATRRALRGILARLEELQPRGVVDGRTPEELISAIENTRDVVADFSRLAESVAAVGDAELALELHRWFGLLFLHYDVPEGYSVRFNRADFDYFKFLGHELYVTLVAFLLREGAWETITYLLDEPIPVSYIRAKDGPGRAPWHFASQKLRQLLQETRERDLVSAHADLLKERRSSSPLIDLMPIHDFAAADYFLFLRGEFSKSPEELKHPFVRWNASSYLHLRGAPDFLVVAKRKAVAKALATALGLPNVNSLKQCLVERGGRIGSLYGPFFERGAPVLTHNLVAAIGSE